MIDPEAYKESNPEEKCSTRSLPILCTSCELLCEDHESARTLLLYPVNVEGFIFNSRRWLSVSIWRLSPALWGPEILNSLVLPKETRESLQTGVRSFQSRKSSDSVVGRPKGVVYYFHGTYISYTSHWLCPSRTGFVNVQPLPGPPGAGKTLLAEALAESCKLALLHVRLDLTSSAAEFEKTLRKWMRLSVRWGAILRMYVLTPWLK